MLPQLIMISAAILLTGCDEPEADITVSQTKQSGHITFSYPKNWKIAEESITPKIQYIFVETPGKALAIIQSYPVEQADDLITFSKDFSASASTEMPAGKIESSEFSKLPDANGYSWIREDFKVSLLGQSVPHRRIYGKKRLVIKRFFSYFKPQQRIIQMQRKGFS